jgi:hypothetical protein
MPMQCVRLYVRQSVLFWSLYPALRKRLPTVVAWLYKMINNGLRICSVQDDLSDTPYVPQHSGILI